MDFTLSKKHEMARTLFKEFAENEVKPLAQETDENEQFPVETVEKMAKYGFLGIPVPKEYGGQGYCLGSQWSRGQAWGLYGFTLAHLNGGNAEYLDAAEKIAANFIRHIRPDGLTDCDFCQPKDEERIDNIAGAVVACGLLELMKITGKAEYHAAAVRLVDGLLEHCIDWTQNSCGLLTKCTASYHDDGAGRHTNITYGDYFLVEALAKLTGSDPMLWR